MAKSCSQHKAAAGAVCFLLIALPWSTHAQSTCSQFDTVSIDSGQYTYQQDEWNSTAQQCATVTGTGFTLTTANFDVPTSGAPATYPSVYRGCHWGNCTSSNPFPIQKSNIASASTSVTITQPSGYNNDAAYDIWFNQTPTSSGQPNGTEIMIWINHQGSPQPFGSEVATVTIGGAIWEVWTGRQSSWNLVSYVRETPVTSVSNLNLLPFFSDAVSRGSLETSWWLIDVEYGFEIWTGGQGLSVSNFSVSATAASSGGNCSQGPSAPIGLTGTATSSSVIDLSWSADTAPANCTINGYNVYRSTQADFTPSSGSLVAGGVTANSYSDSGLTASTTYYYVVEAVDAAGTSLPSPQANVTTFSAGGTGFGGAFLASEYFSDADGWGQSSAYYDSIRLADVNGDGKPDLCGRGYAGIVCALGNGDGTFGALNVWTPAFSNTAGWGDPQYGTTIMFADINRDGLADVCGRGPRGIQCAFSTGSRFGQVFLASEYFSDAAGWGQSSAYYGSIRLADVNGDGKPDVCGRGYAGIVCALGNGDGTFGSLNVWTSAFSNAEGWGDPQYGTTIMFADVNNDGLADVCGRAPAGIQCALSTGNGFGQLFAASEYFSDAAGWNQSSAYYDSIRLADVNGDGKPDLCGRGYAGIVCALGNGDGTFGPLNVWTSAFSNAAGWSDPEYGTTIMFADINNGSFADVCGRGAAGIVCALSAGMQGSAGSAYNQITLRDHAVAFWQINRQTNTEPDVSGNQNTYQCGVPTAITMPNGDQAALFNGSSQYLSAPSNPSLSISTTHNLTWEMWIQPTELHFPHSSPDDYVTVMANGRITRLPMRAIARTAVNRRASTCSTQVPAGAAVSSRVG